MKKKIIIILTSAAVLIGVYVVYDFISDGKKRNEVVDAPPIEEIGVTTPEVPEHVNKEVTYLTMEEIESVTDARDPFETAPVVAKEYEKREKDYNDLRNKIEKRIKELEDARKKAEADEKGEAYKPNEKTFEEHMKEEIEKIVKGNKPNKGGTTKDEKEEVEKGKETTDKSIIGLVKTQSKKYSIEESILLAIIGNKKATDGDVQVKNPDGSYNRGLMQISTKTSKWLASKIGVTYKDGIEFDNETNIKMGAFYLSDLKKQHDNIHYMLTAYYVGPGGAERIKASTGSYESSYSRLILNRMK